MLKIKETIQGRSYLAGATHFFLGAAFLAAFLGAAFLGAAFLATFLGAAFLAAALVTFLGAAAFFAIDQKKVLSEKFVKNGVDFFAPTWLTPSQINQKKSLQKWSPLLIAVAKRKYQHNTQPVGGRVANA